MAAPVIALSITLPVPPRVELKRSHHYIEAGSPGPTSTPQPFLFPSQFSPGPSSSPTSPCYCPSGYSTPNNFFAPTDRDPHTPFTPGYVTPPSSPAYQPSARYAAYNDWNVPGQTAAMEHLTVLSAAKALLSISNRVTV